MDNNIEKRIYEVPKLNKNELSNLLLGFQNLVNSKFAENRTNLVPYLSFIEKCFKNDFTHDDKNKINEIKYAIKNPYKIITSFDETFPEEVLY